VVYGKSLRLGRLFHGKSQKICIVPLDHGTTYGPIEGLQDCPATVKQVVSGGADAVILHKGLLKKVVVDPELVQGKYIMHLSASTALSPEPNYKIEVGSVEEAIKYGADGVSVHVNLGTKFDPEMIKNLSETAKACSEWGMPLLAMMYAHPNANDAATIAHMVRLADELGVDIVKVNYPGSLKGLRIVVEGSQIPVIIAGGVKTERFEDLLAMINDALSAGAAGVAIGRNVFQSPNPEFCTGIISRLVHGELSLAECSSLLKKEAAASLG
jgi:predicted phospho-2-dehydro-3-deoxyheptonate aldolase